MNNISNPSFKAIEVWTFLENSDFQRDRNGEVVRWNEVHLTRHDERPDQDYKLLVDTGCGQSKPICFGQTPGTKRKPRPPERKTIGTIQQKLSAK